MCCEYNSKDSKTTISNTFNKDQYHITYQNNNLSSNKFISDIECNPIEAYIISYFTIRQIADIWSYPKEYVDYMIDGKRTTYNTYIYNFDIDDDVLDDVAKLLSLCDEVYDYGLKTEHISTAIDTGLLSEFCKVCSFILGLNICYQKD